MTKRFASPFAPLHLNGTAADELERLARMFVQDHIGLYEQFLSEDNSRVDPQRWKLVSEQGACRAYGERRGSIDDSSGSSGDDVPIHADTPRSELPTILVTGTVLGDLEDAVYGYICPTLDQMRVKTSYEVYFCKPCLDEALSSKAQAVARDEIITSDEVHEWSNTYGSSSGDEPVPLDDLNDHQGPGDRQEARATLVEADTMVAYEMDQESTPSVPSFRSSSHSDLFFWCVTVV
ncbi:hypothetical protein PRNP1_015123 [Phytophthora ramorum]